MNNLLSLEEIERCIKPVGPAIAPGAPCHEIVCVVVGAGVYRLKTVAIHYRVSGKGSRTEKQPRRVDVIATPLDSMSHDWKADAQHLATYLQGIKNPLVYVDSSGLGTLFQQLLKSLLGGGQTIESELTHWGRKPEKGENWNRFYNLRAQGFVHACEAVKDGRVTIQAAHQLDWVGQGLSLSCKTRADRQYQMESQDERRAAGIPPTDYFDTLCMAFMESVR